MKSVYYIIFICMVMSITVIAQDGNFEASNSYVVFKNSSNAPKAILNFKNKSGDDIVIGTLSLIGAHSEEFNITSDGCSGITLYANQSCNVEVAFIPKNDGTKNALLEIPYGTSSGLYVFLTNSEDKRHNVIKRLAPVLYDVHISEELNASQSYTLRWSLIGYHKAYKAMIVMFDCTDIAAAHCGSSYSNSEKFLESELLLPESTQTIEWRYYDQNASRFNYVYTAAIPAHRMNGDNWNSSGNDIVIRFYVLSDEDANNKKSSLSLIVPGNLAQRYYDTSGRKIEKTLCPSDGCSE